MVSEISTLAALPFHVAGRFPKPNIVGWCTPDGIDTSSTRESFEQIRDFSLGLAGMGLNPGDRVAIICETRPEWLVADLGALTAGAVTVPVYPTLPADRILRILADAGVSVAVASDELQASKVQAIRSQLPELRQVVVIDAPPPVVSGGERHPAADVWVTFDEVTRHGHQRLMREDGLARMYKETATAIRDDQLATIIYTSGTTGDAKGVMLTHGAAVANIVDASEVIHLTEADEALSFLPLCHALERMVVYLYLYSGATVTFAESLDSVARDMVRVRPTIMTGVPRVFEKLRARILEAGAQAPLVRRLLFQWALGVALRRARAEMGRQRPGRVLEVQTLVADRLVLTKIRERTGGRLRFVVSAGAPLSVPVGEFLFTVGIPVLEGYGLTETAPVLTVNPETDPRLGTVGKALPRVELRIAENGEVLARGPNLMLGYYGQPAATAEAICDGWFHTGDIGALDADGYLRITDRKKELIVTAAGKNVAPQPIELQLKQHRIVAEAVLVGDRRRFISGLIVPDFTEIAARVAVSPDSDPAALVQRSDVRALFEQVVEEVNSSLPPYERLRRFALLPREFTIAAGELTPTLKVKRGVVANEWRDVIDGLYAEPRLVETS